MNKYSYVPEANKPAIQVGDMVLEVIMVKDHLDNIMKTISSSLTEYTRREPVVLDFSSLRKRGSKTSHDRGVSTGAASFAKMFSDLVNTIDSVGDKKVKPIVILKDSHPDFQEYEVMSSNNVIFLRRNEDWEDLRELPPPKKKPNWELSRADLKKENERRQRQASPWNA